MLILAQSNSLPNSYLLIRFHIYSLSRAYTHIHILTHARNHIHLDEALKLIIKFIPIRSLGLTLKLIPVLTFTGTRYQFSLICLLSLGFTLKRILILIFIHLIILKLEITLIQTHNQTNINTYGCTRVVLQKLPQLSDTHFSQVLNKL